MATKRIRRTRTELREMMILAGKEVLLDIEPTLGFDDFTYKAVFEHLSAKYDQKVTIGSVHERIWASLRDYQLDVLDALLLEPLDEEPPVLYDRAFAALSNIDNSTLSGRRYAVTTVIRLSSVFLHDRPFAPAVDMAHTVRQRLSGMNLEDPEIKAIAETMTEIRRKSNETYASLVRSLLQALHLRVRADAGDPEQVIHEIALLGNAVQVGLESDLLDLACSPRNLPTGLNGEMEEWYPDAIALWSHVRAMLELDGDDLTDDERRL